MGGQTSMCVVPPLVTPTILLLNRKQQPRPCSKSKKARLFWKLHRQTKDDLIDHSQSNIAITGEFPVEQLHDIYVQKHAFDDLAFAIEFKSLPNFEELSCISATRPTVASKNRFLNILPIDATRVVLNILNDDPATDYINGNYISGYKCANKFIATQGPKPDTCEDFWRMMWELKLKSIVMLTNTTEDKMSSILA
ncbi:unnamed protein product [Adineta ricciae]|uniref:Tyrosine-protein phosphatase domain-containing protein n=1 Tax=Adineta ricciae TaxID=249248 RepID=A0A815JNG7_ADIRI|nr:unnamed protein product [Adineta ricciae]